LILDSRSPGPSAIRAKKSTVCSFVTDFDDLSRLALCCHVRLFNQSGIAGLVRIGRRKFDELEEMNSAIDSASRGE
jgi:hypothetical protein